MLDLEELGRWPSASAEPFVVWGPFPLRRLRLLSGAALLTIALFVGYIGTLRDSVRCARVGPAAGQCQFLGGARGNTRHDFAIAALTAVGVKRTESHHRGRSTPRGQVVLYVAGREITLRTESPQAAEEHAAELRNFTAHADVQSVAIATERVWWGYVFVALMGLFGGGLLYSVVAGRRRFRLSYNSSLQSLEIARQWPFGIADGPIETLSLRHPVEVEIDWGRVEDFFTSSRNPGASGGRLFVRLADGNRVPIAARLWPGYGVHLRAAERLRVHLLCPQRTLEQRQRAIAAYEGARPRPAPQWTSSGGKVATAWLGACVGSLLGLFLSASIAVAFRLQRVSDPAGGFWFWLGVLGGAVAGVWLAFRVTQRADER